MPLYYLPLPAPPRPTQPDPADPIGSDVALGPNGMTIVAGDFAKTRGEPCAIQSVTREHIANPGALAHRPDWGVGATDAVFRDSSSTNLNALAARSQNRLKANPRVGRINSSECSRLEASGAVPAGAALLVDFVPAGSQKAASVVLRGKR